jgi:hypothetical protein
VTRRTLREIAAELRGKPLVTAIALTAGLLAFCAVAIFVLNKPAQRDVYFRGRIRTLKVPNQTAISLAGVSNVVTSGGRMEISRITKAQGSTFPPEWKGSIVIGQAGGGSDPSTTGVQLIPLKTFPRLGATTITLAKGSTVDVQSAREHQGITLVFRAATNASATLTVSVDAGQVLITEADRSQLLASPAVRLNHKPAPMFLPIRLTNERFKVHVGGFGHREIDVTLRHATVADLMNPLDPSMVAAGETYTLHDLRADAVAFTGSKDADLITGAPADLTIVPSSDFALSTIRATNSVDDELHNVIEIGGRGTVTSLKQLDREVLPTELADVMSGDPTRRGIIGTIFVFIVFSGGTLLKRASDIIAKAILPDEPS